MSLLAGIGLAILLVEKKDTYPMRFWNIFLRKNIKFYIGRKPSRVLLCVVCTSFWTTLISDIAVCMVSGGHYFFWPMSGFAAAGITYLVFEMIGSIGTRN
jgi:hypothetical protein